ncbi:MAG: DUF4214 domain-containing protein [Acidobacteriota bacterium]
MVQPANSLEYCVNQIRLAAEKREKTSTTGAVAEVIALIHAGKTLQLMMDGTESLDDFARTALVLSLTPASIDMRRSRYKLHELLQYDDHEFIWNAYRALLKREPDEIGFKGFLGRLRSGQRTKIDVLASIRYSPEGRRKYVSIEGLLSKALVSKAARLVNSRR